MIVGGYKCGTRDNAQQGLGRGGRNVTTQRHSLNEAGIHRHNFSNGIALIQLLKLPIPILENKSMF